MLIIWDFDGVICDSDNIWADNWDNLLQTEKHIHLTEQEKKDMLIGISEKDKVKRLEVYFPNLQIDDDFKKKLNKLHDYGMKNLLILTDGVDKIFQDKTFKQCIATGGNQYQNDTKNKTVGIDKYFGKENCFTADMVKNGKPDPEIFLLASRTMGEKAQNCVVIEDSVAGIIAGKKAGMKVLAFIGAEANNTPEYAKICTQAGADKVFNNMDDLHTELLKLNKYNNEEIKEVSENGTLVYELKEGHLTATKDFYTKYFPGFKFGMKDSQSENHWNEEFKLSPKKKTLINFGGNQTRTAQRANGNLNHSLQAFNFKPEQQADIQLVACYRENPSEEIFFNVINKSSNKDEIIMNSFRYSVLNTFMTYIGQTKNGKFEKYSDKELIDNFKNIIIDAQCYGVTDVLKLNNIIKESVIQLGYSEDVQKKAMQQIVCLTNNSQQELNEPIEFTTIHKMSSFDKQFRPQYEKESSSGYPNYIEQLEEFNRHHGTKSAFINIKQNEMLMVFDKILKNDDSHDEHNKGFYTSDVKKLTSVGKKQSKLQFCVGQYWYNNKEDIVSAEDFLRKSVQGSDLENFAEKSFEKGKKLALDYRNVLKNHSILASAKYKFNNDKKDNEKEVINKYIANLIRQTHKR